MAIVAVIPLPPNTIVLVAVDIILLSTPPRIALLTAAASLYLLNAFEKLNHTIKQDAIEKIMRVQLVSQQSEEEMMESFRNDEQDLDELDYSSPSDLDSSASTEPKKMTMRAGPPQERQMNRQERRNKGKR